MHSHSETHDGEYESNNKKERMVKKKKYAIIVGIGAIIGAVLAAIGLGKMKDVARLGKCHCKK